MPCAAHDTPRGTDAEPCTPHTHTQSAGAAPLTLPPAPGRYCGQYSEDELLDMDFLNFPLDHCALDKLLLGVEPEQPNDIRCRIHWCVRPPQ